MYKDLIEKAKKLRQDAFNTFVEQGEAHIGGAFSMIEIIVILYEKVLKKEDKFILSKAHASIPLCLLLREKYSNIPLTTHLELDPGHGIHCTTGSLGHGLPIATGMALAKKRLKIKGKIYVMLSDGECQEGTTWESLLIGAKHSLDNLVVIIDYNRIRALTTLDEGLPLDNLSDKFKAFNWDSIEVSDGHSFKELLSVFTESSIQEKPRVIIMHTVKGKGVKAFEHDPKWQARRIKEEELEIGRKELGIE